MKLSRYLLAHLCLWTFVCVLGSAAYALHVTQTRIDAEVRALGVSAARLLDLQLSRIALGAEQGSRFPDWALVEGLSIPPGACLRLLHADGSLWRSSCRGSATAAHRAAPIWFAQAYRRLRDRAAPFEFALATPAHAPARVRIETGVDEEIRAAWRAARDTTVLVIVVAGGLGLIALLVVSRALRPASGILAHMTAIEQGDLDTRAHRFRFRELQQIGASLNGLAAALDGSMRAQRELAAGIMRAQEDERRRLARELHDEFGQSLTGIAALTGAVRLDVISGRVPALGDLTHIAEAAAGMQQQLRALLDSLGPAALDELGLVPALESLAATWHSRHRGQPAFECHATALTIQVPPALAITVYRIAQEALTNAARHAGARRVTLKLVEAEHRGVRGITLVVDDDGHGAASGFKPGHGLLGMRERAAALSGTVHWAAGADGGTRVEAWLPLEALPDDPAR